MSFGALLLLESIFRSLLIIENGAHESPLSLSKSDGRRGNLSRALKLFQLVLHGRKKSA
jgi:hypothetical protein